MYVTLRQKINDDGGNVDRIVRGFILANQLLQSSALSSTDKECMRQWVQQVLLPSNAQTVSPEVGCQGLKFLLDWSQLQEDRVAQHSLFGDVRMILANTGLVQMLSHYSHCRKDGGGSVLVYNKMPCFYSSSGPKDGKGKNFF